MSESNRRQKGYLPKDSAAESDRLTAQATLYESWMRRLLEDAGLANGMSVLDVGSGSGDVALLAREFVGETGKVVGVDNNPGGIARAEERVQAAGFDNVSFINTDVTQALALEEDFDAVVGRRVLVHLPDAAEAVRSLVQHVRPGGVVAFQELGFDDQFGIHPPSEHFTKVVEWVEAVIPRKETGRRVGPSLGEIFAECGLTDIEAQEPLRSEGLAPLANMLGFYRSLVPRIKELNVAPEEELDRFDDYVRLILAEVEEEGKTVLLEMNYNAWARKPE